MFDLSFNSIDEAKKKNNLSDAALLHHLKQYFSNANYRLDYNKRKVELQQLLRNDPVVMQRAAELKKKAK
jgi:hypothetical protein